MKSDLGYLVSRYISRSETTEEVTHVVLPSGDKVPLTAEQAVNARLEPHGNFGCSRITVTLCIEIEAQGTPSQYRDAFARAMLLKLQKLREENSQCKQELRRLREQDEASRPSDAPSGREGGTNG